MINRIQTTLAATVALTFIGVTHAQEDVQENVQTAFSIDPAASVEVNYQRILETASVACDEMHPERKTAYTNAYIRIKKECRSNLIEAAISAFADPYLTAFHEGTDVTPRTYAANN